MLMIALRRIDQSGRIKVAIMVIDKSSDRAVSLLRMRHCRNFVFQSHESRTETRLAVLNTGAVSGKSAASHRESGNVTGRKPQFHVSGSLPLKLPLKWQCRSENRIQRNWARRLERMGLAPIEVQIAE